MSIKLDDLQLILLSAASNRADGSLLPAPDSVSTDPERLKAAITSLVRRKLAAKMDERATITEAGRTAIGAEERPALTTDVDAVDTEASAQVADPTPTRAGTKAALLIDLLAREGGATLDDLTAATGWLPHTVRAALTGLRKKGRSVTSEKVDGVRAWRIVG
jgi:hypothetical protein